MAYSEAYEFLFVKPGDYVVIRDEIPSNNLPNGRYEYWIGKVINCIGGARDPKSWTLFQVTNIDNGEILIISADSVERILKPLENNLLST